MPTGPKGEKCPAVEGAAPTGGLRIAVGTLIAERPPQIRTGGFPAYGSHLGCLTAKRWVGQGWRRLGLGSQRSASFPIRSQVMRRFWPRRRRRSGGPCPDGATARTLRTAPASHRETVLRRPRARSPRITATVHSTRRATASVAAGPEPHNKCTVTVTRGHMHIFSFSFASPESEGAPPRRRSHIDCLEAIMRERNLNSRTTPQGSPPEAVRFASLTSNSPRAPLCQANNDPSALAPRRAGKPVTDAYSNDRSQRGIC
jgi:hypothetical protein